MRFFKIHWPALLIFGIAFSCRFLYLTQYQTNPLFLHLIGDGEGYFQWGQRIASGDWIGQEVFYQAPLYPYFLGLLQSLFPFKETETLLLAIRSVQMVLGSLACVFIYWTGYHVFSRSIGIVAGLMASGYAPAIYFDGLIQKAGLGFVLLCGLLWQLSLALNKPESPRPQKNFFQWGGVGLFLGTLALLRENTLLLLPLVLFWPLYAFRHWSWLARWRCTFACGLGVLLLLGTVGIRNGLIGNEWVVTTSQLGPNLYLGNNAQTDGTYRPLVPGHGSYVYEQADAIALAEQALGRSLSEGEVSDYWVGKTWDFIQNQPFQWVELTWRKWGLLWNRVEIPDTDEYYIHHEYSSVLRLLDTVWNFGFLAVLGIMGAVLWTGNLAKNRQENSTVLLLLVLLGALVASMMPFVIYGRYRFPLVPLLLLFASYGVVQGFHFVKEGRWRVLLPAGLVGLGTLIFVQWPLYPPNLALGYHNIGLAYNDQTQWDSALHAFNEALQRDPRMTSAYHNRGTLHAQQKRFEQALQDYNRALTLNQDLAETYYNRALALTQLQEYELAVQDYQQAIQRVPDYHEAYLSRGSLYSHFQQQELAFRDFEMALQIKPDYPLAYYNRGTIYLQRQQYERAIEDFSQALRYGPPQPKVLNSRGVAYVQTLQYEKALQDFNQAIAVDSNFIEAYVNRGWWYRIQQDQNSACQEWRKACDLGQCQTLQQNAQWCEIDQ